ncbi:MAG: hypothetical protein FWC26_03385 [Fibromonadales bacterium]|nr:hypothetical protein [Fibromonadales bacterium]
MKFVHEFVKFIHHYGVPELVAELDDGKPIRMGRNAAKKQVARKLNFKKEAL